MLGSNVDFLRISARVAAGPNPVDDELATNTGCSAFTMKQLFPEFIMEIVDKSGQQGVQFSVSDFNEWFAKNYGGDEEGVMDYGGGDLHNMYDYLPYVKSPYRVEEYGSDEFTARKLPAKKP